MKRLSAVFCLVLCALLVEGNSVSDFLKQKTEEIKRDVNTQMTTAANKARSTAQDVLNGISASIVSSESWIDEELSALSVDDCKPDIAGAKKHTKQSLWKCLEMARVVSDGTDIASGGFGIAADIVGTADNFLQSLTACIIGPSQSMSQLFACYLSAIGTIATGVAQNIEEVEHYITVVKRDVEDIHAAIALCGNETLHSAVEHIHHKCISTTPLPTTDAQVTDAPITDAKTDGPTTDLPAMSINA